MFRIARAFLVAAPAAFVLVLTAFLAVHSHATERFIPYPLLADALGAALSKRPLVRYVAASIAFFVPLYLMSGVLLFFADAGVSAAAPLWSRRPGRRRRRDPSGEPLGVSLDHGPCRSRVWRLPAPSGARR